MSFKPIDPKRDEYRRYLERVGLIESLTKVFVRILRVRPDNPIEYLLQNLGEARLHTDNIVDLQDELENAHQEIQRLRDIINSINPELLQQQPPANNNCATYPNIEVPTTSDNLCSVGNKLLTLSLETAVDVNIIDKNTESNDLEQQLKQNPSDPVDSNESIVVPPFNKDLKIEDETNN